MEKSKARVYLVKDHDCMKKVLYGAVVAVGIGVCVWGHWKRSNK